MAQTSYDYLIVGGGMVADSAAKGIRELDGSGTIGILGEEPHEPFPRPALSKKLWTDPDFGFDDAALATRDETGADLHLGTRVTAVDPGSRLVTVEDGDAYEYGRLLLATGGRPQEIEGLSAGPRVLYFRTLTDYHHLRVLAKARPRVAVVGGGYIGAEIAAALVQQDCQVVLLHPGEVLGDSMFPAGLAERFERLFTDHGVEVAGGSQVAGGQADDSQVRLQLVDGDPVEVDAVVLGLGIEPAGELARDAGLRTADDGSVVVDERLRTSDDHVWAAGDVAEYPDAILGRRRVEHVDNATTMGTAAGRILAGSDEVYDHTPYYYSEVFGVRYEAVGTLDASLETIVEEGSDGRAIAYYRDDDRTVGVLLWQVEEARDAARAVLADPGRDPRGSIDPDGSAG